MVIISYVVFSWLYAPHYTLVCIFHCVISFFSVEFVIYTSVIVIVFTVFEFLLSEPVEKEFGILVNSSFKDSLKIHVTESLEAISSARRRKKKIRKENKMDVVSCRLVFHLVKKKDDSVPYFASSQYLNLRF